MKNSKHSRLKEVERAIARMPAIAKEQERRYFEEMSFANKTFKAVIQQILKLQKRNARLSK